MNFMAFVGVALMAMLWEQCLLACIGLIAEKGEAYRKPFPGDKALSAGTIGIVGIVGLSVPVCLIPRSI